MDPILIVLLKLIEEN